MIEERGMAIAKYKRGRVVKVDTERSQSGFCILVAWNEKIGRHRRHTWAPERSLEILEGDLSC